MEKSRFRAAKSAARVALALLLACCMVAPCLPMLPAGAEQIAYTSAEMTDIARLIVYYRDFQDKAATDIERTLAHLTQLNAKTGEAWGKIMNYWSYVNSDMVVNRGTVPDDLPGEGLAIVILGFGLNDDGSMKPELVGRLQMGLQAANKYPAATVVVTGGGTAANAPDKTEGGVMGEWLLSQGLPQERLIVEDSAKTTVGNAKNTYEILHRDHPEITSLLMVTSDYHVPRGTIIFYSQCLLSAYDEDADPLEIAGNVGFGTSTNGYESIALQATGVAQVAGVILDGVTAPLSHLTALTVQKGEDYAAGADTLSLKVTARYDSDYERDVTALATVEGYDKSKGEEQTVSVSYEENGVTITAQYPLTEQSVTAHAAAVERNVCEGKTVHANCNEKDIEKITNGVIANTDYWASYQPGTTNSNFPSSQTEVTIDLAGRYAISELTVYTYWNPNQKRVYQYRVEGSLDGQTWFFLGENISNDTATERGITFSTDAKVAYIRLKGISTTVEGRTDINNIHIVEITAMGRLAGDLSLDGALAIDDVTALLAALGSSADPPRPSLADLTGDGIVTVKDVSRMLAWLGAE